MAHPGGHAAAVEEPAGFNFQKKIVPWEEWLMEGGEGEEAEAAGSREAHLNRPHQELLVVASLIDKTPNLAGLARTCFLQ